MHEPVGITREPGGWRIKSSADEAVLLRRTMDGVSLFTLGGRIPDKARTRVQLLGESGGLDVRDPLRPTRPLKEGKNKAAVINAIFGERRDPDGTGRYILGHGEIWREDEA